MPETKTSLLTLEQQKKLTLTGVTSVDAFSDTSITLNIGGVKAVISGTRLKVVAFSEGSGNFAATGEFVSIRYGSAKGSFWRRLFK